MNNLKKPNNFDHLFDPGENLHSENKCLFHDRQFVHGKDCNVEKKYMKNEITHNYFPRSEDETQSQKMKNNLNEKPFSGDRKYNENGCVYSFRGNITHATPNPDWKSKNIYSMSDFDRANYWKSSYFRKDEMPLHENCQEEIGETDKCRNWLFNIREYLMAYQESYGVPRTEYSFATLITIMGQATGRSLLCLLYVIINMAPVVEIFLHILRFVLDKAVSIKNRKDFREMIAQCFVLVVQLLSIYICLIFIFGFIVLPIVQMVIGIISKIMFYN